MENVELNVPKYSWINNGEDIDKSIYDIINKYKYLKLDNDRLKEENKSLKSDHYKDIELQRLKEENDILKKELLRGFSISDKEQEKINNWLDNHNCKYAAYRNLKIGGPGPSEYRFGIIPGIGYNGYVRCKCGKEFCFYEE